MIVAWTCICGRRITGSRVEHCPACHETFTNTRAGDSHWIGPFTGIRRCLTPDEMERSGKLTQNHRGHWTRARKSQAFVRDCPGNARATQDA